MSNEIATVDPKALAGIGEELLKSYHENADAGSENLGGAMMPILKIIQKDAEDYETVDGVEAKVGQFYHTSNKKVYDNPEVSIVYIENCKLPKYQTTTGELQYTVLVIGYILEDNSPFMMYVKGKSLSGFFNWQKSLSGFKSVLNIPMYAFVNVLSSTKEQNDYGKFYVLGIDVAKDKKTGVKIISDPKVANTLKEAIPTAKKATRMAIDIANGEISSETQEDLNKVTPKIAESVEVDEEDINF